jgi:rSAM/selenodomain-associated transferase 1
VTEREQSADRSASRRRVGVFAKYWQPGATKTRLGRVIGDERAGRLSQIFLATLLQRLAALPGDKQLWFSPHEREAEFAELAGPVWTLVCQGEGHLGERLCRFFATAAHDGVGRSIAVGSDSPTLPVEFILQAFDNLVRYRVVLGPSDDGGYYLLGIAGFSPPIFDGISWGTPSVWPETVARLAELQLPFAELPRWYDVDQVGDLDRLAEELAGSADQDLAVLRQVVAEILESRREWKIV